MLTKMRNMYAILLKVLALPTHSYFSQDNGKKEAETVSGTFDLQDTDYHFYKENFYEKGEVISTKIFCHS